MATTTAKMALRKPATSDTVNVTTDVSDSMQKLDDTLPTTNCTSSTKPGTPFTGQLIFETDTKVYRIWDAAAWRKVLLGDVTTDANSNVSAYPTGFKNRVINGTMEIAQRGAGAFTATAGYTLDQWKVEVGTDTHSTTQVALSAGTIADRITKAIQTVNTTAGGAASFTFLAQRIENVSTLAGKTVVVSFWAKASAGTPSVAVELQQFFGTTGSPSASVNTALGKVALTASWARYSVSVALPSISGKTLGTDVGSDYLRLTIYQSAGSDFNARTGTLGTQAVSIQYTGIQLEEGAVATPFEIEPYNTVLARCQRYLAIYFFNAGDYFYATGISVSAVAGYVPFMFPVPMRVKPAVSQTGDIDLTDLTTTFSTGTIGMHGSNTLFLSGGSMGILLYCTVSGGMTVWRSMYISSSAGGTLIFSAEL